MNITQDQLIPNGIGIISENNIQYTFPSYDHQHTTVSDIILTQQEISYQNQDNELGQQLIYHRSPNGQYYVIPDDPGEIVQLVEDNTLIGDYTVPNDFVQLEDHYERERQRILLESTMSPLLAAVNDIAQREAELESYLNRKDSVRRTLYEKKRSSVDERNTTHCLKISDKPVESRAKATLPTNYLTFYKEGNNGQLICAKKEIPIHTQFGPIEGEVRFTSDVMLDMLRIQSPKDFPLLLIGKSRMLDVSNENTSNWMRFVHIAHSFSEQNLHLVKENDKLYFQCVRAILPREELRVGYSNEYAEYYNLSILYPNEIDKEILFKKDNSWECSECDQCFSTSMDLQSHLEIHENNTKLFKRNKRKKKYLYQNNKKSISLRCHHCNKAFITNFSLKKHLKLHKTRSRRTVKEKKINVESDKKFRIFTCIYCSEKFRNTATFREHISAHAVKDLFYCFICKKKYLEYSLVRKHIKTFHEPTIFPCNICGRQFKHKSFLHRHKIIHSDKYDFLCTECDKKFKRKDKLKEHITRIHSEEKKNKIKIREEKFKENQLKKSIKRREREEINDGSQYLKISPKKQKNKVKNDVKPQFSSTNSCNDGTIEENFIVPPTEIDNYYNYTFKCTLCILGFKRRGMLVNHLVKRHPDIGIHTVPELNLPIFKPQSLFYCYYCSKSYKSNAKRKLHMIKYHPGQQLPPSARNNKSLEQLHIKIIGNIRSDIHQCCFCYKQYASRTRLQIHFRKDHSKDYEMCQSNEIYHQAEQDQHEIHNNNNCCVVDDQMINYYRPPESPENKLLKLSSAALELEDPKFFDFLNEDDGSTICNENENDGNCEVENQKRNVTGFSKVHINFKVVNGEFSEENSSNTELNGLPQLFEESIACI